MRCLQLLLERGASPVCGLGSPLVAAVAANSIVMTRSLLEAGAHGDMRNYMRAVGMARSKNQQEVLALLMARRYDKTPLLRRDAPPGAFVPAFTPRVPHGATRQSLGKMSADSPEFEFRPMAQAAPAPPFLATSASHSYTQNPPMASMEERGTQSSRN